MTQEVMDALLLHEIKVVYENSLNELLKFHDLLCNLRLKVKELEANLRFKEKRGGIVIMPNPKSFKEKVDYLIKNYSNLLNKEKTKRSWFFPAPLIIFNLLLFYIHDYLYLANFL
jgi:hypothetical protein